MEKKRRPIGKIILVVVIVVVVVTAVFWWLGRQQANQVTPQNTIQQGGVAYKAREDACSFLTAAIANNVLGANAQKSDGATSTNDPDVSVSSCIYSGSGANPKTATFLLRVPTSAAGEASNKQPFTSLKSGAQSVSGYGDMAFWDPELKQLNVLKNHAWLIFSFGGMNLNDRTLDQAKQLANQIVPAFN